jgi:hypothetical protein
MAVDSLIQLIAQLLTLVTAVIGLRAVSRGIGKVHDLVNSQSDKQMERVDQLTRTLTAAQVPVPPRPPSITPPGT